MSYSLFNKLTLTALLTFGLTYQPEVKASHLAPDQVFLGSVGVGMLHGLFNALHFKAIKANPQKYEGFYVFTYLLARTFRNSLIGQSSWMGHKDYFLSSFGHGLGQSFSEAYLSDEPSDSGLGMNFTLVESAFAVTCPVY